MADPKNHNATPGALKEELASRDYEVVSVEKQLPDGRIIVQANKLQPVTAPNDETLYVLIPVTLHVTLDEEGHIKSIESDGAGSAAIADATHWLKTLINNEQLEDPEQGPLSGATHQIVVDEQHKRVVRRQRYSAF